MMKFQSGEYKLLSTGTKTLLYSPFKIYLFFLGKSAIVSHRLVMFQSYFSSYIGKPAGWDWRDVLQNYEETLGTPSEKMREDLNVWTEQLFAVTNFDEFFEFVEIKNVDHKYLTHILRRAIVNSWKKRYHN